MASPAHIACRGKGRKRRVTPITTALADMLAAYLDERSAKPGHALFPGPAGAAMSTDAIAHRLAIHLQAASPDCPSLAGKHVTMHTLRHTAAMRFPHAGVDTSVIALWLGHEQIATTASISTPTSASNNKPSTGPAHLRSRPAATSPTTPSWLGSTTCNRPSDYAEQSTRHRALTITTRSTST